MLKGYLLWRKAGVNLAYSEEDDEHLFMNSPLRNLGKKFDDFVYSRAIQFLGNDPAAYLKLAARDEQMGWIQEAREIYLKSIAARPQESALFAAYAAFLFRQEDFSE